MPTAHLICSAERGECGMPAFGVIGPLGNPTVGGTPPLCKSHLTGCANHCIERGESFSMVSVVVAAEVRA